MIVDSELFVRICIRICVLKNMQIRVLLRPLSQCGDNKMHISDIAHFSHSKNGIIQTKSFNNHLISCENYFFPENVKELSNYLKLEA